MDANNLFQKLKDWRRKTANSEGIEPFRVFANKVLENIAEVKPKNKNEIMAIKGIRDKKFARYGEEILALINNGGEKDDIREKESNQPLTIREYLNLLNSEFKKYKARVQGEVSSLDIRNNYLFFSLKDKDEESVLSCFMWKNNYELCGISLEIGMEVVVDGYPEIYAPAGRFSFKTATVELVGEGALKRAYDKLKQKLEKEGLFADERKKPMPDFPQRIGLITSESGAVIHDFLNNLGKYGYHISFVNSRVEGQIAVRNLVSAVEHFEGKNIDVLVIIRGGGSLESLQAFNNEALVRKIANCKMPVICGIGHDKDMPLASLVADKAVSTPTAVTTILNRSWEKIVNEIFATEKDIMYRFQRVLSATTRRIELFSDDLMSFFSGIFQTFERLSHLIQNSLFAIAYKLKNAREMLSLFSKLLLRNLEEAFKDSGKILNDAERQLQIFNPVRQLKLGYSIIYSSGKVVKSVQQVKPEDMLDITVSDGKIKSKIEYIN